MDNITSLGKLIIQGMFHPVGGHWQTRSEQCIDDVESKETNFWEIATWSRYRVV